MSRPGLHRAQHRPDVQREQVDTAGVLGLALVTPGVPAFGDPRAQVVPGRHLVPAPRRVPVGEGQVDQPARAGHPDHLLGQPHRVRDMLEHVRGEHHVGGAVADREPVPVRDHRAGRRGAPAVQFVRIRLEQVAVGPAGPEGRGEPAASAAHVHDRPAVQLTVLGDLLHGVLGEVRVELLRVGLLGQEHPEEPGGPEQARARRLISTASANRGQQAHAGPRCGARSVRSSAIRQLLTGRARKQSAHVCFVFVCYCSVAKFCRGLSRFRRKLSEM